MGVVDFERLVATFALISIGAAAGSVIGGLGTSRGGRETPVR